MTATISNCSPRSARSAPAGTSSIPPAAACCRPVRGGSEYAASAAAPLGPLSRCRGVLRERPVHVLAHQGGGVLRAAAQRLEQRRRGGRIAKRDGDVAQPTLIADAADGAACRALQKLRLAPGKELGQLRVIQTVAHGEVLFGGGARELVPRARQLTVIAAVDAVADGAAEP